MIERRDAGAGALPAEERLLQKKIRNAKRALAIETLWPRLWLPLGVAGIFILLSAFEVWKYLPPRVHEGVLAGFGAALFASLIPLIRWRRPSREEALSRLERASAIDHRPLTAFNDTLSLDKPTDETAALWRVHQARAAALIEKLKAGAPHPRVDKHDPFALRAALILSLAAALAWSWGDLGPRLGAAFTIPELHPAADFRLDAWITPPPYTRKEPIVLADGSLSAAGPEKPVAVPEGSTLTVKVNGPEAARYGVLIRTGLGEEKLAPSGQSGKTFREYTAKLKEPGTLAIAGPFGSEQNVKFTIVKDQPPKIAFDGPIEVSHRFAMLFKYKVEDDYGVVSAEARIERAPSGAKAAVDTLQLGKPPIFPLALPRAPVQSGSGKTYKELTSHPWAGLPVVVTLTAKDEMGQQGESAPRGIILPERKFLKPLARAVITERRAFVEDPSQAENIAKSLDAIAEAGEDEALAPGIFLNLRSATWRLRGRLTLERAESVVDQLWDVAVRIEDGNLSEAERELRAAQDKLKDALERGASPEEVQSLMKELRQAMDRFLQELASRQAKNRDSNASSSPDSKSISAQDLQRMLDKIESLAKTGSAEAAEKMLNQLRDIMENLKAANQNGQSNQEGSEGLKRLNELSKLMQQQQELLDQTFRAAQQGDPRNSQLLPNGVPGGQRGQKPGQLGQPGQADAGQLAERQQDIQKQLQQLLQSMSPGKGGEAASKLRQAEQAMGKAGQSLGANQLPQAGEHESNALENLRQGTRAMAQQMMQAEGDQSPGGRDPLGRDQNGGIDRGDSVKVPDAITVQRAREILDELHRRLGDRARPELERDYLERLLKGF